MGIDCDPRSRVFRLRHEHREGKHDLLSETRARIRDAGSESGLVEHRLDRQGLPDGSSEDRHPTLSFDRHALRIAEPAGFAGIRAALGRRRGMGARNGGGIVNKG